MPDVFVEVGEVKGGIKQAYVASAKKKMTEAIAAAVARPGRV
jgi:hypothetical protein